MDSPIKRILTTKQAKRFGVVLFLVGIVSLGINTVASLSLADENAGGSPEHVVVHLLDPRIVTLTSNTMPIEWRNAKTDVIGKRTLNVTEAARLRKLLRKELVDDKNTPFCGHSPAYAVTVTREGRPPTTVTLCGTCGTWAKSGALRVLHGKDSLQYLDTLLPLPDVFRPVDGKPAKELIPFDDRTKRPFADLK